MCSLQQRAFQIFILCFLDLILLPSATVLISNSGPDNYHPFESEARSRRSTRWYIEYSLSFIRRNTDPYRVSYLKDTEKGELQNAHNKYRRQLGASNMEYIYWDKNLAWSAQRHADRCDFAHSKGRNNVGENIWAAVFSNFDDAVKLWFDEGRHCGCKYYFNDCCGHYTQVAWATTNRIGCGYSKCRHVKNAGVDWNMRYVLVCHYTPGGNQIGYPAFQSGQVCNRCPAWAPVCRDKLCSIV